MSDEWKWGSTQPPAGSADFENSSDQYPRYEHYHVHEQNEKQNSLKAAEQPSSRRKSRKNNSFGKKAATVISLAVIFGLVAGVVFQAVNIFSNNIFGTDQAYTRIPTTESVAQSAEVTYEGDQADMQDVIAASGTVAGVAQAAMPSVVAITSVSVQEIEEYFWGFNVGTYQYPSTGSGSGIIVGENDDELLIATNNHVVEGATTLNVFFIGTDVSSAEEEMQNLVSGSGDLNLENSVSAKIKGTEEDNDLAVVAVQKSDIPQETMNQIKIAQLGNSDELVVGEQVVAIGNALGYGQSVTSGWVSALDRSIALENGVSAEVIQTDAAINPGNSGGALLNMQGELIGINSAKYEDSAVEGMGYAIPISEAQPILEELMNRKTRDKVVDASKAGVLGIEAANIRAEAIQMYGMPAGAFVYQIVGGEAAEAAGIQKGDIIVKLDGQKVSGREDLEEKLQYYEAGEAIEVVVARLNDGEYVEQAYQVTLGSAS